MRGDRVEIVVDSGAGVLTYEIEATKAGRRVEVATSRGVIEVTEVTRNGEPGRSGRFMAERVAAPGGEYRIESQRDVRIVLHDRRQRRGILGAAQHAGLEGCHRHVFEHGARLRDDHAGLDRHVVLHAHGVLHGERRDHRRRMTAEAGEGFDVGLNAGAAGRVVAGEHQHYGAIVLLHQ